MSTVFPDRLTIEAQVHAIDSTLLEPCLASLPERPPRRGDARYFLLKVQPD